MVLGMFIAPQRLSSPRHFAASLAVLAISIAALPVLRRNLIGYMTYTTLALKCAMDLGAAMPSSALLKRIVSLFGEHVLFCYLAHIVILQAIFRLLVPHRESPWPVVLMIIGVTWMVLAALAVGVAFARRRFSSIDRTYRFVFA